MFRIAEVRRAIASVALVAVLAPGPALAQTSVPHGGGASSNSLFGAFMSVACGAGININTQCPTPIGVAVTAACCMAMVMDAINSIDPK